MTIDEHDVEKYLAGALPDDHPAWSQTAAFAQRLSEVYPRPGAAPDAASLAATVDEARQVRIDAALRRNVTPTKVKPSRLVLAAAAAAVVSIASGVGMAAALNGNVGQSASELKVQLPVAPVSVAPVPTEAAPAEEMEELKPDPPKVQHKASTTPKTKARPATHKSEDSHDEHEDEHEDEDDD
jgi:hypothetical protein